MTAVGDLIELAYGKALKDSDRDGGDVPVVGSGGIVGCHSRGITDAPSIVVGRKGSIGSVTWVDGPAWPIDTAYFVKPRLNDLDRRWAYWMLKSLRLETMNKSAAVPGLNRDDVYRLEVNVPPLSEQRRVAAILDSADALRAKRRQVLAGLDSLTQSIFQAMFGAVTAHASLGDVAVVQGGLQVSSARSGLPVEVPYLRVANAQRGYLDLREIKTLRATSAEVERTLLQPGDLLLVEGHANPDEVGRAVLWNGEIPACVHQNHLIRARPDSSHLLPVFACTWLNTDRGAAHFRRDAKTTSGLNTISATTVRAAPIPVPPLSAQRHFAERVSRVHELGITTRRALAADDELFASLQARAFSGRL